MSHQGGDDDDSFRIQVEPPKEDKVKMSSVMPTYELIPAPPETNFVKLHFQVNKTYLSNLQDKKEEVKITEEVRKKFGASCLIFHEFDFTERAHNGLQTIDINHKGGIALKWEKYKGLQVILDFGGLKVYDTDYKYARLIYRLDWEQKFTRKSFMMTPSEDSPDYLGFLIDDRDISLYSKPSLAMQIIIHQEAVREKEYRGIRNEGCTCYMNSTLQILFFIRPLRKIIVEYTGTNKLVLTLRSLFCQLMDIMVPGSHLSSVDAYDLIKAYGRFDEWPLRQQDIHQFLLGFLDQLQTTCTQLKQLWLGSSQQILTSEQPSKPYESTLEEDFNCIDIQLQDSKGNTYKQLWHSLQSLLHKQDMDDMIDTDEHGKVRVSKCRQFGALPNIIFMNLKRYKYRAEKQKVSKILDIFNYPEELNFGFLHKTPSGEESDYVLFAVAVHSGHTYNSGHYFSFVNTSTKLNKPHWIKFNDSNVTLSSKDEALSFVGGKQNQVAWSDQYERFTERSITNEQTAYLLAYLRKDRFVEYQSVNCTIPKDYLKSIKAKKAHEETEPTKECQVYLFDEKQPFNPFRSDLPTVPITLRSNVNIFDQLKKDLIPGAHCSIKYVFRVNSKRKKIKQVKNFVDIAMTPERILNFKRGHLDLEYMMLVPQSTKVHTISDNNDTNQIYKILKFKLDKDNSEVHIVQKPLLEQFLIDSEQRIGRKGHIENSDKDRLNLDWSDYVEVDFGQAEVELELE